jgi:DNA-binding transcriptional MerR regulator
MKMQKRQFRIGELAEHLAVEKFVIRFWEKEFDMKTNRSHGGQRFYDDRDLEKFSMIKFLLYDKGFTIAGAKQQIKEKNIKKIDDDPQKVLGSHKTTLEGDHLGGHLKNQLLELREKLVSLQKLL